MVSYVLWLHRILALSQLSFDFNYLRRRLRLSSEPIKNGRKSFSTNFESMVSFTDKYRQHHFEYWGFSVVFNKSSFIPSYFEVSNSIEKSRGDTVRQKRKNSFIIFFFVLSRQVLFFQSHVKQTSQNFWILLSFVHVFLRSRFDKKWKWTLNDIVRRLYYGENPKNHRSIAIVSVFNVTKQ